VVTNEKVFAGVRQGLNVERGLNDGICVPILFVFLALAAGKAGEGGPWHLTVLLVVKDIGIGLAAGLLLTLVAGWLLKFAWQRHWLTETWIQIPIVALALICFTTAQLLGGSGFIAAFSGPIAMTVVCTIIFSIVAHGVSANPWANGWVSARKGDTAVHPQENHIFPDRLPCLHVLLLRLRARKI